MIVDVYYEDEGKYYKVVVPEGTPAEFYKAGLILGPPDFDELDLSQESKILLHNELFNRGIITTNDILSRGVKELHSALQTALRVDVNRIMEIYNVNNSSERRF